MSPAARDRGRRRAPSAASARRRARAACAARGRRGSRARRAWTGRRRRSSRCRALRARVDCRGPHPGRPVARALLLVEELAVDAVRVALERQVPVAQVRQQHRRDPHVVLDHLALGEPGGRVEDLVEVRERERAPLHLDLHALRRCHAPHRTASVRVRRPGARVAPWHALDARDPPALGPRRPRGAGDPDRAGRPRAGAERARHAGRPGRARAGRPAAAGARRA